MSRYKIAAITAIAAMSLLTGATASANEVIGTIVYPEAHKTSDLCTSELKSTNYDPKVLNIALPGDRGSEGVNTEQIAKLLECVHGILKFSTLR